jgi:anaerobic sulfite reductase subunit A
MGTQLKRSQIQGERVTLIFPLFSGKMEAKTVEIISEYKELTANRMNLYRFLGRLYNEEIDQKLLDHLKTMSFPTESGEAELDKGYRLLEKYLNRPGLDPITDLAVDYARVFLGAGVYEGTVANPYESVYTSPERLIMQDARDEVLATYRAKGLDKVETLNVPEDHISLEFEFMAYMCQETMNALDYKDWSGVTGSLMEQMDFLVQHLMNWIPGFCTDIEKCATTDFYKALAKITSGYLRLEHKVLEAIISETIMEIANS